MRSVRTSLAVLIALLAGGVVCGCASVAAQHPVAAEESKASHPDSKVTCRTETPPGSRVALRICETAAQREAREAAVRDTRDSLNRPTPSCAKLGPNGCAGGG